MDDKLDYTLMFIIKIWITIMNSTANVKKANIKNCIRDINKVHKQRLGFVGPYIGMILILLFAFALLPLYLFLVIFNNVYFWIRRQKPVDPSPFFNFDRHKKAHLRFADKVWCEYCEWANGSLQWALAITNEIERRYCPIKNQCHPHCEQAKEWRNEFLDYEHQAEEIEHYYHHRYLRESKLAENTKK